MVSKAAVFLLSFTLFTFPAAAQPTLPDITGITGKGTIALSWNCQYNNVKAISVFRSSDSNTDFTMIGYVENVSKGLQTYTDPHPLPGNNCYNIVVGFRSGLTWRSNHFCLHMEKYMRESDKQLSPNPKPQVQNPDSAILNPKTRIPKPGSSNPILPKIKLPSAVNDTIENPYTIIKSRYIFTDENTGHVDMYLPEDVAAHHYSVKFYDLQNHVITEVPWIHTVTMIIDKRNFQRKGVCKFILRKDDVELEEGYFEIKTTTP